jgi:Arc-like DNA binding domain
LNSQSRTSFPGQEVATPDQEKKMADLTLELPEELLGRIAAQAAENGRSVEDEVLYLLMAWRDPLPGESAEGQTEDLEDQSG